MLAFRNITKKYGPVTALEKIDLSIQSKTTTLLIGPSGCGKSTLLRMAVGLILPDRGSVTFQGRPLCAKEIQVIRQKIGYVIQAGGLFPHCTARNNVTLMARHLGWSRERIDDRLKVLIDLTHFPEAGLDRYPAQLSGGQCQRVSLMRALMLDPDLLLLDEPLGALDPMIRRKLQEELREIFRSLKKTVLMVTHDLQEAGFFGDEIVLMRKGSIVQKGSLESLCRNPSDTFVTAFIEAQQGPLDSRREGNP